MRIQTFTNGDIFGVKKYSDGWRRHATVACAGGYNQQRHGFSVSWIDPAGVTNNYQVIRFPNLADARELAREVGGDIVSQRGTAEFVLLPIGLEQGVKWAWVNSRKLRYISPSAMERFRRDYPDYVDNDDEAEVPAPATSYRGFTF